MVMPRKRFVRRRRRFLFPYIDILDIRFASDIIGLQKRETKEGIRLETDTRDFLFVSLLTFASFYNSNQASIQG